MKSLFSIGTLIISSILLSSCYSSRSLVDDDVYVVKNSLLPTDESLNDETSYSSYRYKKNNNIVSDDYYLYDDYAIAGYYPTSNWYYSYGTYCYNHNLYYGNGFYNAFGDVVYDPFSGRYYLNPNYNPYCYFGSRYLPEYYGMAGYGYGISTIAVPYYIAYGYNAPYSSYYNSYNYNNSNPVHYGPRGSSSGYTDPAGRLSSPQNVKLASTTKPNTQKRVISELKPEARLTQNVRSRELTSRIDNNTRYQINQRQTVELTPTEGRSIRSNYSGRYEGRPVGREINANPRGGFEPGGGRIESSPRNNPSGGQAPRGGNNPKPATRRN